MFQKVQQKLFLESKGTSKICFMYKLHIYIHQMYGQVIM